jgi:hypothetical protein
MKTTLSILLCLYALTLSGQNQKATVILKSGDTLYLEKFVQEEYLISGVQEGTNKPRKVAMAAIASIMEGCNYEKNEVDDMTGQFVKISKEEKLGGAAMGLVYRSLELHVSSISISKDQDTLFSLKFRIKNTSIFSMDAGAKVLIKCSNDKVYELNNLEGKIASCVYSSPNFSIWEIIITTPLSKEMLNTLSSCPVTKIRVYFNDGYDEVEIKDKNQNILMKVLSCINS